MQLARCCIETPIRTEWIPVLNEEQFVELWETGVFQKINNTCGINISDYEEVVLRPSQLEAAIGVVREFPNLQGSTRAFFEGLASLLKDAAEDGRSVYFIF